MTSEQYWKRAGDMPLHRANVGEFIFMATAAGWQYRTIELLLQYPGRILAVVSGVLIQVIR